MRMRNGCASGISDCDVGRKNSRPESNGQSRCQGSRPATRQLAPRSDATNAAPAGQVSSTSTATACLLSPSPFWVGGCWPMRPCGDRTRRPSHSPEMNSVRKRECRQRRSSRQERGLRHQLIAHPSTLWAGGACTSGWTRRGRQHVRPLAPAGRRDTLPGKDPVEPFVLVIRLGIGCPIRPPPDLR